ncbi:MAG: AI-2E family transporter [Acetobacteraceae bacterium]
MTTTSEEARLARLRGQYVARIVLAIGLSLLGLYILGGFLRALVWAAILAIASGPLYRKAQLRFPPGRHNVLLPLLFTIGTTLLFVVPLALIAVQVGEEVRVAAHWITQTREYGAPVPDWLDKMPVLHERATAWWEANLADPAGARALLGRLDRAQLVQIGRALGTQLVHRTVLFAFALVTLFFLFRDGQQLAERALTAIRRLFGPQGEPLARQIVASIHGTVDGLVLVGLGVGAVLGVGYVIAGVPHPALLGCATAIAAVIPMGAPIVLGIASLLAVATHSPLSGGLLFGIGMAVIFVADHAIRPALIGGATRLPFVWVLLGILGGVETFGLLGLFLGPAVMAALILLWREWTGDAKTAPSE